jgi:hypothetical protein
MIYYNCIKRINLAAFDAFTKTTAHGYRLLWNWNTSKTTRCISLGTLFIAVQFLYFFDPPYFFGC